MTDRIVDTLEPIEYDTATHAPLPVRLGHRDPYLEPAKIGSPLRGLLIGAALGLVGWAILLCLIWLTVEVL